MYSSSIKSISTSESTLPCSYISSKIRNSTSSSSFLKNLVSKPTRKETPTKHIPISIPAKLTPAQKEAALPFLAQPKPKKPTSSKSKALSHFFKKLAAKDCFKSSSKDNKRKTQYKLTFIPIIKNMKHKAEATEFVWYDNDSTLSSIQDVPQESIETTATEYAQRIWDEDQTVYENLDNIVEWIGNGQPTSNAILESYMSHFDFEDMKLEEAFRELCSKLHFKGETQQIDRILLQFSCRYFECNPDCLFGSEDVVHAIVYSLLLLNTDLHVAQGDYKKMTQSEFIKNTMSAISGEPNPNTIRVNRLSIQSFDWVALQRTPSHSSDCYSTYAQSLDGTFPRKLSALTLGSKTWQTDIRESLKQMYNNIRQRQLTNPSTPPTSMRENNRISVSFKRSFGTIHWKEACGSITSDTSDTPSSITHYQNLASQLEDVELPSFYTSNAPYYKEGMVTRKHLLEKTDQKAKHRDWKDCFMVIERSQLRMYKLNNNKQQLNMGDGNWMSHAQLLGAFDLKHTLATILPSGYSRQRQFAFTLQLSSGAVFVFQVGSAEQVQEWVSTCNYWAARESKEPLVGGISSMEYGWGPCLDSTSEVVIHDWQTPACPTISSKLDEVAQLNVLYKHVKELSIQLDQHRDIKSKMVKHFIGSKYNTRSMMNWENKSRYLLNEIIKYQNYCNSIEHSLALQADLRASSV